MYYHYNVYSSFTCQFSARFNTLDFKNDRTIYGWSTQTQQQCTAKRIHTVHVSKSSWCWLVSTLTVLQLGQTLTSIVKIREVSRKESGDIAALGPNSQVAQHPKMSSLIICISVRRSRFWVDLDNEPGFIQLWSQVGRLWQGKEGQILPIPWPWTPSDIKGQLVEYITIT